MLDLDLLHNPAVLNRIAPNQVFVLAMPKVPHLRFEWHPVTQRVYMIRLDVSQGERLVGEPIAYNVGDHGAAWNFALVWARGYRERDRELDRERISEGV